MKNHFPTWGATSPMGMQMVPMIYLVYHWPCQEPKLEAPTIYKAYVREYPHKIWPYMVQYYWVFLATRFLAMEKKDAEG